MITNGWINKTFSGFQPKWSYPQADASGPAFQDQMVASSATDHLESGRMAQDKQLAAWARGGAVKTEPGPSPSLPEKFQVMIDFYGQPAPTEVKARGDGSIQGPKNYDVIGLSFSLPNSVACSILVNLEQGLGNPTVALGEAVKRHVKAFAASKPEKRAGMACDYTVKAGHDGKPVATLGTPPGKYDRPDGVKPFATGNFPDNSHPVGSSSEVEIDLSSHKKVHSTADRLAQARTLADKITFVLKSDGRQVKADLEQIENVANRLAAFTSKDLSSIEENGYKVLLVNPAVTPKGGYPGGRPGAELDGKGNWKMGDANHGATEAYVSYESKVLVIVEAALDRTANDSDVLLHELGHVISDCRVKDGAAGVQRGSSVRDLDQNPEVVRLFQAYALRCGYDTSLGRQGQVRNPDQCWSFYACEGPQEYLADGVAALKQGGDDLARLKAKDPSFHSLLQRMFPESATEPCGPSEFGRWLEKVTQPGPARPSGGLFPDPRS